MKTIKSRIVFALAMVLTVAISTSNAQRWGDADGNAVLNPNSSEDYSAGGPTFYYDPVTGIVSVETAGANGVVDSSGNGTVESDDVGHISSLLSTAAAPTELEALLPPFADGVAWGAPVFFNGSIQLQGTTVAGNFLPVSAEPTDLYRIDAGLGVDDFRDADGNVSIEVGINFADGTPGGTLFSVGDAAASGAFRIVPEPSSIALLGTALLAGLGIARRRR